MIPGLGGGVEQARLLRVMRRLDDDLFKRSAGESRSFDQTVAGLDVSPLLLAVVQIHGATRYERLKSGRGVRQRRKGIPLAACAGRVSRTVTFGAVTKPAFTNACRVIPAAFVFVACTSLVGAETRLNRRSNTEVDLTAEA